MEQLHYLVSTRVFQVVIFGSAILMVVEQYLAQFIPAIRTIGLPIARCRTTSPGDSVVAGQESPRNGVALRTLTPRLALVIKHPARRATPFVSYLVRQHATHGEVIARYSIPAAVFVAGWFVIAFGLGPLGLLLAVPAVLALYFAFRAARRTTCSLADHSSVWNWIHAV
jgi:Flp pilus assembly protein TadB